MLTELLHLLLYRSCAGWNCSGRGRGPALTIWVWLKPITACLHLPDIPLADITSRRRPCSSVPANLLGWPLSSVLLGSRITVLSLIFSVSNLLSFIYKYCAPHYKLWQFLLILFIAKTRLFSFFDCSWL